MRKWFILIVILLLTLVAYNYVYKDHRNVENEIAIVTISSTVISNQFAENPAKSEKTYLDKTIEITGFITESNIKDITLDNRVFCQFEKNINSSIKIDSRLKIKGRCIGYDDLLEQVKLDQCSIIK